MKRTVLMAVVFAAACGGMTSGVRKGEVSRRAAFDFNCPAGSIKIAEASPGSEQFADPDDVVKYTAAGCGRRAVYGAVMADNGMTATMDGSVIKD